MILTFILGSGRRTQISRICIRNMVMTVDIDRLAEVIGILTAVVLGRKAHLRNGNYVCLPEFMLM